MILIVGELPILLGIITSLSITIPFLVFVDVDDIIPIPLELEAVTALFQEIRQHRKRMELIGEIIMGERNVYSLNGTTRYGKPVLYICRW